MQLTVVVAYSQAWHSMLSETLLGQSEKEYVELVIMQSFFADMFRGSVAKARFSSQRLAAARVSDYRIAPFVK